MNQKRSSSLERRLSFYPHPKYLVLFLAFAHDSLTSKPKTVQFMVKRFIDDLSDSEKKRLLAVYEKMTPEQKLRTQTIPKD